MDTSGKAREGWMALIPLGAFGVFVIASAGGPQAFMRTAGFWLRDAFDFITRWLR